MTFQTVALLAICFIGFACAVFIFYQILKWRDKSKWQK
jgi:hypothetical protein